ncbi:hypothetical protein VKT23_004633 [Stygiomarasmius scandens]|uniref:Uncharacterized protein n=1 Tax=Marasmiellus scandens TaxID=2682957 RepID=A0ABR1JVG9_9AGAR
MSSTHLLGCSFEYLKPKRQHHTARKNAFLESFTNVFSIRAETHPVYSIAAQTPPSCSASSSCRQEPGITRPSGPAPPHDPLTSQRIREAFTNIITFYTNADVVHPITATHPEIENTTMLSAVLSGLHYPPIDAGTGGVILSFAVEARK